MAVEYKIVKIAPLGVKGWKNEKMKIINSTFANVLKITTFAVQNFESFRLNKRKQERFPPAGIILKS